MSEVLNTLVTRIQTVRLIYMSYVCSIPSGSISGTSLFLFVPDENLIIPATTIVGQICVKITHIRCTTQVTDTNPKTYRWTIVLITNREEKHSTRIIRYSCFKLNGELHWCERGKLVPISYQCNSPFNLKPTYFMILTWWNVFSSSDLYYLN